MFILLCPHDLQLCGAPEFVFVVGHPAANPEKRQLFLVEFLASNIVQKDRIASIDSVQRNHGCSAVGKLILAGCQQGSELILGHDGQGRARTGEGRHNV